MPPREILIANRHPRLRLDRRAVTRMIHTLDANFDTAPTEKGALAGKSKIEPARRSLGEGGIRKSKIPPGELSVVFLTDAALAKLHGDYLDDPSATDVITFSGDPTLKTAGEICVSVDAARRQTALLAARVPAVASAKEGRSTFDFSTELALYLVHGWLHLAGFDDLQPAKKRQMRRAEARALQLLQASKAVPRFSLRR